MKFLEIIGAFLVMVFFRALALSWITIIASKYITWLKPFDLLDSIFLVFWLGVLTMVVKFNWSI